MADINTRPFSKNYSGLINQSVIALGITLVAVASQELMKRRRRSGKHFPEPGLGSRETWEFGYLYQGRSWAKNPSPPSPRGWPLSWVKQVVWFPEAEMNRLRGVDATLYIRFLRGCFYFAILHTFTTFLILFPIHVELSADSVSQKSMTRASITSLVLTDRGKSLLWVHICLLFWITISWVVTLIWICNGAFSLRSAQIQMKAERIASGDAAKRDYHPHPHPQFGFTETPDITSYQSQPGLPLRTVMVSNVPPTLRTDAALKEYFEYFMTRDVDRPAIGLNASTQPGFLNKSFAFLFNRAKHLPAQIEAAVVGTDAPAGQGPSKIDEEGHPPANKDEKPKIERVVIARKMTELADLLERREDVLRSLETAHLKLAQRTVMAVKSAMARKAACKPLVRSMSRTQAALAKTQKAAEKLRDEPSEGDDDGCTLTEEERMEQLIQVIGPFVDEFELNGPKKSQLREPLTRESKRHFRKLRAEGSGDEGHGAGTNYPPSSPRPDKEDKKTIWDALLSVPRSSLDPYQPLIRLSTLFRGKTVPTIDYNTRKLAVLNNSITENRAKAVTSYSPVSTAFVTFADAADARKACKYLAVHPDNPLACMVTMAPQYSDLDWIRVMKSSYNTEFLKDWIVNCGVWAFTLFWLFPVSFLVGLVSIQTLSIFIPKLEIYLRSHPWQQEVIQSFLPTLLVALLALLIPLILLLIAKKAHTITTLSALHDLIMTRYYKFLIVNVLVFFCVGTAAVQSVLQSFKTSADSKPDIIKIVADSFPVAGPFYVGWLIFTTAMHAGLEIALFGLPLLLYPTTSRQVTPRKRSVGIRPRTLNFYYWLPNHLLVLHVLLLFSVLNPFVLPFGAFYYFIQNGVIKNQLIHVYAKNYEGNGKVLLIRMVRYSLDGLILTQAVFLAYMVVLARTVNVALAAFLIVVTATIKIWMTRMCRAQFEKDDISEAAVVLGPNNTEPMSDGEDYSAEGDPASDMAQQERGLIGSSRARPSILRMRVPTWINWDSINGKTMKQHKDNPLRRNPIPFDKPKSQDQVYRLNSRPTGDESYSPDRPLHGPSHPKLSPHEPAISDASVMRYVIPHPPPPAWDDQTTLDLPYDNPYYTRAISHELWLPRNPFGILDLDDTISLKVSIAVDSKSRELGTWLGVAVTTSPPEITPPEIEINSTEDGFPLEKQHSHSSHNGLRLPLEPLDLSVEEPSLILDGSEIIISRPGLRKAEKVYGIDRSPRRPSTSRPSTGQRVGSASSVGMARMASWSSSRPGTALSPKSAPPRSFSQGSHTGVPPIRANTISTIKRPTGDTHYAPSLADDPALQPDVHAQGELVQNIESNSHLAVSGQMDRENNISFADAIAHEVEAEEVQYFHDRVEEEEAEARKAMNSRSWMTSWMYKKR